MTLLLHVPVEDVDHDGGGSDMTGGEKVPLPGQMARRPVVMVDPSPYVELLEDCELSAWAKQAGAKYLISELDALWLLAQALLLDGAVAQTSEELCGQDSA
jgi:hypothetical protein